MATVDLLINGVSYWADTVYESCHFESQVNGVAGPCAFRVRDPDRTKTFVPGQTILLTVDGNAVWRGFVSMVNRVFSFPALNVADFGLARFIDIVGTDINILLLKRIVSNQTTPTNVEGPLVAAHTPDSTAIATLFAGWLDLSGDGLDTTTLVENVADTTWTESGTLWEGSDTWSQAMQSIANLPAAIYYIDPDKNFVYTDVDTPSAPFNLSDQPNGTTTRGYREMEVLKDGTGLANDVMAWGMGYGSQTPVFDRETDATSQADHGLWQLSQISFGVYKQATIDRIAQSIIDGSPQNKRGAKNDRVAVQCVTYVPGLRPAQKVDFTSNAFGFNDVIPVRKMEIDFPAADTPKYTLTLSHEIDTPFGFFDPFLLHLPYPKCPPPLVMGPNGKCIMPPIIHGCNCGITDSFTRVMATGIGTADCGIDYEAAQGSFANWSVGGSKAIVTVPTGGSQMVRLTLAGRWTTSQVITAQITSTSGGDITTDNVELSMSSAGYVETVDVFFATDGILGLSTDGDYAQTTLGFSPRSLVNMRIATDGTNGLCRVWLASDPEPITWTLTAVLGTPTAFFDQEILFGASSLNPSLTATFDTWNALGVTRCFTRVYGDDFERTEATGWGVVVPAVPSWTNGGVWVDYIAARASVSSGNGVLAPIGQAGGAAESVNVVGLDEGYAYPIEVRMRFKVNRSKAAVPAGPNANNSNAFGELRIQQDYGDGISYLSGQAAVTLQHVKTGAVRTTQVRIVCVSPGGSLVQQSIVISDIDADVWHDVAARFIPGEAIAYKVWQSSATEPSWSFSTVTMDAFSAIWFTTLVVNPLTQPGDTNYELIEHVDFINFDYAGKPCYPGAPIAGSGVSSNAWVCESFITATTMLTLAHPFLVNSPRVWLNGLLQPQSSYTQNGIAGTITFDFTPISTDNARVCYWATA